MLRPNKHMNPDQTSLALAGRMLKRLKRNRVEPYSKLLQVMEREAPSADVLFPTALSLLFLLGLIEYRSTTDSFEYIGP